MIFSQCVLIYEGILVGMPDSYYRRVLKESQGVSLGPINSYGTGIIFTPKSDDAVAAIKDIFESKARQFGMNILAWRSIETGKANKIALLNTKLI